MHRGMIGAARPTRAVLLGVLAVALLGAILAARPAGRGADPTIAAGRAALLHQEATDAKTRLDALIDQLQAALDAGRRGSALVIDGDESPRPDLSDAAAGINAASDEAALAAAAAARVDGVLAAVAPRRGPLPPGPSAALFPGISAQFAAAAEAAEPFVARRQATDQTLAALADALAALEGDDPRGALADLDRAEEALDTIRDWEEPPTVLPFWLDTTGELLSAARRIATASLAGDADAVARAAARYARAADDANRADTALAIAIAESGSSLAATPLQLLADALEAATEPARGAGGDPGRLLSVRPIGLYSIDPELATSSEPVRSALKEIRPCAYAPNRPTQPASQADVLAVPIYREDKEISGDLAALDAATGGAISRAIEWGEFNIARALHRPGRRLGRSRPTRSC